jgi:hypothetical protein
MANVGWLLLALHYADVYWLVMPQLHRAGVRPHWLDLAALTFLAAATALFAQSRLEAVPALPLAYRIYFRAARTRRTRASLAASIIRGRLTQSR